MQNETKPKVEFPNVDDALNRFVEKVKDAYKGISSEQTHAEIKAALQSFENANVFKDHPFQTRVFLQGGLLTLYHLRNYIRVFEFPDDPSYALYFLCSDEENETYIPFQTVDDLEMEHQSFRIVVTTKSMNFGGLPAAIEDGFKEVESGAVGSITMILEHALEKQKRQMGLIEQRIVH